MDDRDRMDQNHHDAVKEALNNRERGARWQKIQIDQFGYALNLFITLAVAALGYCFQLLKDLSFRPGRYGQCFFWLSMILLTISIVIGIAGTWCRLKDFRGTTKRAKGSKDAPSLESLRKLGNFSWISLRCVMLTLAAGTIVLAISLIITYGRQHLC